MTVTVATWKLSLSLSLSLSQSHQLEQGWDPTVPAGLNSVGGRYQRAKKLVVNGDRCGLR